MNKKTLTANSFGLAYRWFYLTLTFALLVTGVGVGFAQEVAEEVTEAATEQAHFDTPEELVNHLIVAVARADKEALALLFREGLEELVPLEGLGGPETDKFLSAWASSNTLIPEDETTRTLAVGEHGWTLPIPIVLDAAGWAFDTAAGIEETKSRRIGKNELSVIQAALAYRDAQFEYSAKDRDGDGVIEYAQKILSATGTKEGLYWKAAEGDEEESPLGSLFAKNAPGDEPYLGYRYKILKSQGENAEGGAMNYVDAGNLTGGFALLAWPAEYGETGVMSFTINQEGTVYQTDLGPDGESITKEVESFDPDENWAPVPVGFTDINSL
jgi:hypothetical protein